VISFILSAVLGYLIGSVPFAYLLVLWGRNVDIRKEGSGNVGTLNSYLVTKSGLIALAVLILDVCKGAGAVLAVRLVIQQDFEHGAVGGFSAVVGHAFPIWLRFKGGRGLAPAAGAFFVLNWLVVPFWLLVWGAAFFSLRAVNPANALASAVTLLGALVLPSSAWEWALRESVPVRAFRAVVVLIMAAVLIRLVGPAKEFLRRGSS
jgi:glycerol-3-phosphate acyltransferase PlsY